VLRNPLTTFVLGSIVSGVIPVALASASRAGFVLGVLGVLGILAAVLSSRKRALWIAELLTRAAGPDETVWKVAPVAKKRDRVSPKVAKPAEPKTFADIVLGLRGLGVPAEDARHAAGQATMRLPEGAFDDQFKLAVQVARRAA